MWGAAEPATGGEEGEVSEVCKTEEFFREEALAERLTGGGESVVSLRGRLVHRSGGKWKSAVYSGYLGAGSCR
jgi:hypothetical protein